MKVTIVNHSDVVGGASMVSLRLMEALQAEGVDARMLVMKQSGPKRADIAEVGTPLRKKLCFLREHLHIFLDNGFSRENLFKVSTGECGLPLHRHPWIADADVVLLSWINQGMLSFDEIRRIALTGKAVAWMMHDMWPMTGICHHAGVCEAFRRECGYCSFLGRTAARNDLSHKVFVRKQRLYSSLPKPIMFVAVSDWLARKARESALLGSQPLSVIYNPFPVRLYRLEPRRSREELGLPPADRKLIVMCAARLDNFIKDLPSAVKALNILNDRMPGKAAAVFVGEIRRPEILDALRMPYCHLGNVSDQDCLRDIYAHSDAVISSSSFETLASTLIEGMAAGAVPVSFGGDGRDDIISHNVDGYLAAKGDCNDLAEGLYQALSGAFSREELHRSAERRFSDKVVALKYIDLFKSLINKQ